MTLSGDTLAVGAPGTDGPLDSGAVSIFALDDDDRWAGLQVLRASDARPGDGFGAHLAIAGDTLFVAAPGADRSEENAGAVYVFTRGDDALWTEQQILTHDAAQADERFGASVSLSGNTALIGTLGANSAYVFTQDDGEWSQQHALAAPEGAADAAFGRQVAVHGDWALVSAHSEDAPVEDSGAVYVYLRSEDRGFEAHTRLVGPAVDPGAHFGRALALSEGHALVTAAPAAEGTGTVYAFTVDDEGVWTRTAPLSAPFEGAADGFGGALALSTHAALAGAPHAAAAAGGAAYFLREGLQCTDGGTCLCREGASGDLCDARPDCGDGIQQAAEQCDAGADPDLTCAYGARACTVCDNACQRVAGTVRYCGDEIVQADDGEACDDGNEIDDDACSNDCRIAAAPPGEQVFEFTGAPQQFVVPVGHTELDVELLGAVGGNNNGTSGGFGGQTLGTVSVTPGETLWIYVGGRGQNNQSCGAAGGFNGGGPTGVTCCGNAGSLAGTGGGASDIRTDDGQLGDRVIVAAGGGGAGDSSNGGAGGGVQGAAGDGAYDGISAAGGTQVRGGRAGGHHIPHACSAGTTGSLGQGGTGDGNDGGGGGGGYYGGGGGANNGGGAGGSSWWHPDLVSNGRTQSGQSGQDGRVTIRWGQ